MALPPRLALAPELNLSGEIEVFAPELDEGSELVGRIRVELINDNVVITVSRVDEAWFGPVSLVVV